MSENYRNLDFDAFTGGIENGGLRSKAEINMIVSYIVVNANARITAKNIVDALVTGGIANYFEICESVKSAIERGLVAEDEEGFLTATDECKRLTKLVENDLPLSVRKKSIELTRKVASVALFTKENKVDIVKKDDESFDVTMHITDVGKDFMVLTLNVPTIIEAETVRDKFLENPVIVYDNLINSIFSD